MALNQQEKAAKFSSVERFVYITLYRFLSSSFMIPVPVFVTNLCQKVFSGCYMKVSLLRLAKQVTLFENRFVVHKNILYHPRQHTFFLKFNFLLCGTEASSFAMTLLISLCCKKFARHSMVERNVYL